MKKLLLFSFTLFSIQTITSQSYNTCSGASSAATISEGVYAVSGVNGTLPTNFCGMGTNSENLSNAEWVKYIPQEDTNVTITTNLPQNPGGDTRIIVYSGACGSLVCITTNDDDYVNLGSGNFLSTVNFQAIQGVTYYIAFDDYWSNAGFDFQLIEGDPVDDGNPFTTIFIDNGPGIADFAIVDLNGDFLDDIVGVNTTNVAVNYQLANGTLGAVTNITTPSADYYPSWSFAAGDFDANGYNDLLYGGGNGVSMMRANNDGTAYTEISYPQYVFSQRSNFVDMNNDGHLDAFVCHDVAPSVSYINDGSNNLVYTTANNLGNFFSGGNYGSTWVDYDNDGDMDMFMAKCGGGDPGRDVDQLYRNNGDGTFTEIATEANLADDIQTWSAAWGDFNNDGLMDVYVGSNSSGDSNKLMRNNGDGTFTNVSSGSGINLANKGRENAPADFNNDGFVDVLSNGTILYGNGDFTFTVGIAPSGGGAIGDINNDGFLDVFNGTLHQNEGNDNNWIKIITIGQGHVASGFSNRNGIGARVEIVSDLGTQIRDVRSGEGFRFMSTLNTHFGIGQDTEIEYIRVYWPSGVVDQVNNPTINSAITIEEGSQTLSTPETFVSDLIIHPNPTTSVLNLSTSQNLDNAIYSVFDINGRRVLNAKLDSKTIDVSSLSSGQYILRIMSGSAVKNQKFIKQ